MATALDEQEERATRIPNDGYRLDNSIKSSKSKKNMGIAASFFSSDHAVEI